MVAVDVLDEVQVGTTEAEVPSANNAVALQLLVAPALRVNGQLMAKEDRAALPTVMLCVTCVAAL